MRRSTLDRRSSAFTIVTPTTTWAVLHGSDRGVLNLTEVAVLLTLNPRTVDHAIEDGTIPHPSSSGEHQRRG
ncbi:MAG: hypothetical protein ABIN79_15655 [Marmoricola sp.]